MIVSISVLFDNVLSRASSTSISVTFRFPSRESFSVMMSEGTSSLTVSPSSSDLASQHSQGKMTVSEPCREGGGCRVIWEFCLGGESVSTTSLSEPLPVLDRAGLPSTVFEENISTYWPKMLVCDVQCCNHPVQWWTLTTLCIYSNSGINILQLHHHIYLTTSACKFYTD